MSSGSNESEIAEAPNIEDVVPDIKAFETPEQDNLVIEVIIGTSHIDKAKDWWNSNIFTFKNIDELNDLNIKLYFKVLDKLIMLYKYFSILSFS